MKLQKFLAILCVVSLVCATIINAAYATPSQTTTVEAEKIAVENTATDASVKVYLKNNVGIATLGFDVGYDSSAMSLKSVDCGNLFTSGEIVPGVISNNPYMVSMQRVSDNIKDNGTLVILNFTLNSDCPDGVYPITIGDGGILGGCSNINEETVDIALVSGSITVGNGKTETTTVSTTTESTTEATTVSTTLEPTTKTTTTTLESTTETTTATTLEHSTEVTTAFTTLEPTTKTTTTTLESTTEATTVTTTVESTETTTTAVRPRSSGSGGGGGSYKPVTTTTTEVTTEITTANAEETTETTTAQTISLNVKVTINSNKVEIGDSKYTMDAVPYIQPSSNSTMVPLRFVALAILEDDVDNADNSSAIEWDSKNKQANVYFDGKTIQFTTGSNLMIIANGPMVENIVKMDNGAVAEIRNGRMYIPFRALGDALGVNVSWDSTTKTAIYETR